MIDPPSSSSRGTLVVDPFANSSLRLASLEPIFPLVGKRYSQVVSDGRKDILRLVQPAPYPIVWPSPIVILMWCARWLEQYWQTALHKHIRLCSAAARPLLLLWLIHRFRRHIRYLLERIKIPLLKHNVLTKRVVI